MSELYVQKQGPPVRAQQFHPERKPWPEGVHGPYGISEPAYMIDSGNGFQCAIHASDWILTHPDGRRKVLSDERFREGYERVRETDGEREFRDTIELLRIAAHTTADMATWDDRVEHWPTLRAKAEEYRRAAALLRAPLSRVAPMGDPEDARKLLHAYAAAMAAYHSSEGGTEQTDRLEELEATLVSRLCLRSAGAPLPEPEPQRRGWDEELGKSLASALNRHSAENGSDTPDFILAAFLQACLRAWDDGLRNRAAWYGAPLPEPEPVGWVLELAPRRDGESWVINQVCWRPDDPNDPESRWAWWNEYAASEPQTYRVRRLLAVVASPEPPTERDAGGERP